jgi:ribosomal RNA assembly protein
MLVPLDIYAVLALTKVWRVAQQTEVSAKRRAERAVAFVAPVESAAPTVEEKRKRKRRETETEVDGDRELPKEGKKKKKRAKLEEEGGGS